MAHLHLQASNLQAPLVTGRLPICLFTSCLLHVLQHVSSPLLMGCTTMTAAGVSIALTYSKYGHKTNGTHFLQVLLASRHRQPPTLNETLHPKSIVEKREYGRIIRYLHISKLPTTTSRAHPPSFHIQIPRPRWSCSSQLLHASHAHLACNLDSLMAAGSELEEADGTAPMLGAAAFLAAFTGASYGEQGWVPAAMYCAAPATDKKLP